MGELLGIPEWLALTLFVLVGFAAYLTYGYHSLRKARRRLSARRPSPTREEFIALLADDVDDDVAHWLWETALFYYEPLAPHPNDHLITDARIDDGDITMDWLPEFAKSRGLSWKEWPDWPKDWDLTVRNFARWLQLGIEASPKA
jgi:hypothetical protein